MIGTIANVSAILIESAVGVVIHSKLNKKIDIVNMLPSLVIIVILGLIF
ncbi:MAG: hypothetical protein WCR82_03345 [Bacteroidales bacterium]|jgi:uncharacterized membrane protein YqgA involved in biofilm formation